MSEGLRIIKRREGYYIVELEGEDHTMGNLLSSTLQGINGVKLAYYELVHPLERRVRVHVMVESGVDIKSVLTDALNRIKELNDEFRRQFVSKAKEAGAEGLE